MFVVPFVCAVVLKGCVCGSVVVVWCGVFKGCYALDSSCKHEVLWSDMHTSSPCMSESVNHSTNEPARKSPVPRYHS